MSRIYFTHLLFVHSLNCECHQHINLHLPSDLIARCCFDVGADFKEDWNSIDHFSWFRGKKSGKTVMYTQGKNVWGWWPVYEVKCLCSRGFGMREGGLPLPPTFQYSILMIWRACDLNLVMISLMPSKFRDLKLRGLQSFHKMAEKRASQL